MSGDRLPKRKSLDAFGAFAYSAYILVGGSLVFGFAYPLRGAVDAQETSICKILRPELRTRISATVTLDGKPVEGVVVNPNPKGKSSITSAADGTFTIMEPEGPAELVLVPPTGEPKTFTVRVPPSSDLVVEFEMSGDTAVVSSTETFMAPEIEAKDLNGNPVKLSDYRGQFVVVNFWATWCEPCITEWPQLHQLAQRLSGRDDVAVLAVSIDSEQGEILPFLERMSLLDTNVQVVWDPTAKVHNAYGSSQIPDTFFVDEEGRLVSAYVNVRKWGAPEAFHCVDGSIGR